MADEPAAPAPPADVDERESKRPRKSGQEKNSGLTVPFTPLDPSALTHHAIHGVQLSPGPVFGCRIAAVAHNTSARVFFASGLQTYSMDVQLGSSKDLNRGKDGILIPTRTQAHLSLDEFSEPAGSEVQSLAACLVSGGTRTALCSMDAHACGHVRVLDNSAASSTGDAAVMYTLEPPAGSRLESGWSGCALEEVAGSTGELHAHTAHHFSHTMHSYQGQQLVRSFYTTQAPTALAIVPGERGHLVCCAEEHILSVWDARQGEKGGLVQRLALAGGGSPIYSLAWSSASSGLLGAAGAERAVQVVDPRKWRVIAKWPSATKYQCHYLAFSSAAPSWCYASGLDYELCAGQWNGTSGQTAGNANSAHGGHGRAVGPAELLGGEGAVTGSKAGFGFRGDSRWLGMVRALDAGKAGEGRDVVVAHTQNGSIYALVSEAGSDAPGAVQAEAA